MKILDTLPAGKLKFKTNLAVVNFTECNQFILASAKKLFTARMRLEFSKLPSYYIHSEDDPSFYISKNLLCPIDYKTYFYFEIVARGQNL